MTIEEAVKERINRFNELWLKETDHSFEDDEKWCDEQNKKEMKAWKPRLKKVLKKHGFSNEQEYTSSLTYKENGYEYSNSIDEIDKVLQEKPNHSSLYSYEMFCINEAKACAEWILSNKGLEWWTATLDKNDKIFDIIDLLKSEGFSFDKGHSGNSMSISLMMAACLISQPENFKYLHGAMASLVGDEGYHDDRSDVPKKS